MTKGRKTSDDIETKLATLGKHLAVGKRTKDNLIRSLKVSGVPLQNSKSRVNAVFFIHQSNALNTLAGCS